jgi:hypothetical protein
MSGYSTYTRWQRIEAQAQQLGFRLGMPNSRGGWSMQENGDMVSVYPDAEALPIYTRDAELFTGTFSQVETWMRGWLQAQQYDAMLRMTNDKRRQKFEDAERARQAEQKKRLEQQQMLAVLKASDAENSKKKK